VKQQEAISKNIIYKFYVEQLEKFHRIGIGKKTEHNTTVTKSLISITEKRLKQLKPFITRYVRTKKERGIKDV
jgi:ribosomal protein S17E